METSAILTAFGLTLFAGLSTGIGSVLAFVTRQTNTRFLSLALGFSAGVMIYVSFAEILFKGREALMAEWGVTSGSWAAVGAFFGGMLVAGIIDKLVPSDENPHEPRYVEELAPEVQAVRERLGLTGAEFEGLAASETMDAAAQAPAPFSHPVARKNTEDETASPAGLSTLRRTGIFTALAIAIHNFPEGLATFTAALSEPKLGVVIAVAIAIHNIPEGIAVSVPIYYATGDRKKAFLYSFLSGLAEPVGAVVGYLLMMAFVPAEHYGILFGLLFSAVAGIMVFISLDELLPTAQKYGEHHLCTYGVISGMAVMALSLLLFI